MAQTEQQAYYERVKAEASAFKLPESPALMRTLAATRLLSKQIEALTKSAKEFPCGHFGPADAEGCPVCAMMAGAQERIADLEAEAGRLRSWRAGLVKNIAAMYRDDYVGVAALCDKKLDRSGELLGLVRDEVNGAI